MLFRRMFFRVFHRNIMVVVKYFFGCLSILQTMFTICASCTLGLGKLMLCLCTAVNTVKCSILICFVVLITGNSCYFAELDQK